MAATIGGTRLRDLIITVVILVAGKWSLAASTDSSQKTHAIPLKRMGGPTGFNLVTTDASRDTLPTSAKRRRRLSLEQNEVINPSKSSKEVEILLAFKSEITGDPLGVLNTWRANDSDPCRWPGVGCPPNSTNVTTVNLNGFNLVGTVSSLLGQLLNLQHLDLSQNFLHGPIPASLGNCSNLLHLNISFNQLTEYIPPPVGNLDKLQTLDLSNNNLTGGIPETLGNCSALQHLDLGTNFFAGGIPSQFGFLSNLKFLSLESSSISGSVPPTLGNCSSLTQLWLSYNIGLGGELPLQLGELIDLQDFRVLHCSFQGKFPMWTLNFTSLQVLNLGGNRLAGQLPQAWGQLSQLFFLGLEANFWDGSTIPSDIGLLINLDYINIGNCGLIGEIPRSIFNVTFLRYLMFAENHLTGAIPEEIGLLRNLEVLHLFSNEFSGTVPSSLSNCSLLQKLMLGVNQGLDRQGLPSWIGSLQNLVYLYMASMNLQGEIPPEIGQLSQLVEILLFSNNLSGVIPASLGNCSSLVNFGLNNNELSGRAPPELGHLSQLQYLEIQYNAFSPGPLPPFIYNLTSTLSIIAVDSIQLNGKLDGDFGSLSLSQFSASYNYFQGPIPESFTNCSNLQLLDLNVNFMSGEIPVGLANLSNLQYLQLGSNHFRGTIPVQLLGNFYFMQYLDFSDNKLSGTIPAEIGQLVNMQQLDMFANQFVGAVPDSLGNCTQLLSVDFSDNRLTGSIPGKAFAAMSSLTTLDLSSNLFSGSWPSQFGGLKQIQVINVSANNISGAIPLGLGGCLSLESLDLSFNQFSGAIPRDLGSLKNLTTFNASYNNFSGPIPNFGALHAHFSTASFLGNPGLCGDILGPQRLCPAEVAAPIRGSSPHCNGFECSVVWVSLVSAVAFVTVLLGALYIFSHRYAKKDNKDLGLVTFTIDPSMRFFTKFDILTAIGAGEDAAIGNGPKSIVYKAGLPGGAIIAIKVLKSIVPSATDGDEHDAKEFLSEAHTLAQLRHRNIIKVIGLYSSKDVRAILLEYMPKGSLHANLHGNAPCELTWAERFRILLGVTHGMVYLHHEFPEPIIHRDLKPSNILLDADLEPKICDFGISKFVIYDSGENGEVSASTICGTFGYMPPEYGTGTRVSTKGDVYSFGVVLLELLTAKAVTQCQSMTISGQDEGLVSVVQSWFQETDITPGITALDILDPTLKSEGASDVILRQKMILTLQLGLFCTRMVPEKRPSMNIVLDFLLEIEKMGQEAVFERSLDYLLKEDIPFPETRP